MSWRPTVRRDGVNAIEPSRNFLKGPHDITIICDGQKISCNQAVLPQSSRFAAEFDKLAKIDNTTRPQTLRYDSETLLDLTALIEYLYDSDYTPTPDRTCTEDECNNLPCGYHTPTSLLGELDRHISMLLVSDRHDLPGLTQLATQKFRDLLETHTSWDTWHALVKSDVFDKVKGLGEGVGQDMRVLIMTHIAGGSHYLEEEKCTRPVVFFRKHQWCLGKYWASSRRRKEIRSGAIRAKI